MRSGIACNSDILQKKTRISQFKKRGSGDSIVYPAHIIPDVNIAETATEYLIIMAIPGLRREDFSIEVAQSVITISAKKEAIPLSWVKNRYEYDYTNWTRAFALPVDADAILVHAAYQNGELIIHIPRNPTSEPQAKATIYVY